MHLCPFCQSPVQSPPKELELTKKQRSVYEYIIAAGPEGVAVDRVMLDLYPDKSGTTLRTAVHYINKAMKPLRIVRRNHRYTVQLLEE
jgi:hypothetical protein